MYVRSRDGTAELPLSPNVPLYSFISRFFISPYPCNVSSSISLSLSLLVFLSRTRKEQTILLSLSLALYLSLYLSSLPLPLPLLLPSLHSLCFALPSPAPFTHLIFILFYSLILGASSMKSLVMLPADYVILCWVDAFFQTVRLCFVERL